MSSPSDGGLGREGPGQEGPGPAGGGSGGPGDEGAGADGGIGWDGHHGALPYEAFPYEGPGRIDPARLAPFDALRQGPPPWHERLPAEDPLVLPWWEAEADDLSCLPPRRQPAGVRAVGLLTVAALVVATLGAGIGEVLQRGTSAPLSLPAQVTSVGAPTAGGSAGGSGERRDEIVRLVVGATGSGSAAAACTVQVRRDGRVLGARTVGLRVRGSAVTRLAVSVPLDRPGFAGSPADARAACQT